MWRTLETGLRDGEFDETTDCDAGWSFSASFQLPSRSRCAFAFGPVDSPFHRVAVFGRRSLRRRLHAVCDFVRCRRRRLRHRRRRRRSPRTCPTDRICTRRRAPSSRTANTSTTGRVAVSIILESTRSTTYFVSWTTLCRSRKATWASSSGRRSA